MVFSWKIRTSDKVQIENGDITVSISNPDWGSVIPNAWSCVVSIDNTEIPTTHVFGATSIQALALAVELVRSQLEYLTGVMDLNDVVSGEALPASIFTVGAYHPPG